MICDLLLITNILTCDLNIKMVFVICMLIVWGDGILSRSTPISSSNSYLAWILRKSVSQRCSNHSLAMASLISLSFISTLFPLCAIVYSYGIYTFHSIIYVVDLTGCVSAWDFNFGYLLLDYRMNCNPIFHSALQ